VRRGTLAELAAYYEGTPPRGEVVVVVEGGATAAPTEASLRELAAQLRERGAAARDVAAELQAAGAARNVAYRLAHERSE
jgi:16S rRNA (cytidine1402-2'-O)-methyltransferase